MHITVVLLFLLAALVCFFLGWINAQVPKPRPLNWMVGGFFFLLLAYLLR